MNLFDLYAKIALDTSDYDDGVKKVGKSGGDLASKLKSGLASAGKLAAKGIAAIGTAAGAAVGGLLALESSTKEYRIAMGKLNTAFEAAGYGAEVAQEAYNAFYGILGDTDTATEASQLLAQLANSEEDVSTWTNIAAGVFGTFGDSLPIEGLIEASNETAKVGKVTGVLADALNWVGISEDVFNQRLEECSSESERNRLIMLTLSGAYDEASEAFYRNNEELVRSRENQAKLDATLAKLGETVSTVKNALLSEFLPSISSVVSAFVDLLNGVEGADEALSAAIQDMVTKAVEKLPEFLSFGVDIITSIVRGIVQNLPQLLDGAVQIVQELGSAIISLLPDLLEAGGSILTYLADGIETGLPEFVASLPEIIQSFLDYITENLPGFLAMGVEIINSLVNGIVSAIPELVSALPQIISSIVKFIWDAIPQLIEAALNIIWNLRDAVMDAIPELISKIPDLIKAQFEAGGAAAKGLLNAGIKLVEGLAKGILTGIPKSLEVIPKVIDAIIEALGALVDMALDVGKNLVLGIGYGIEGAIDWLLGVIGDFADSVMSAIKDFFGIHSPSKKTEYVGDMLDAGVGVGIEKNVGKIKSAIHKIDIMGELEKSILSVEQKVNVVGSMESGMNFETVNVGSSGLAASGRSTTDGGLSSGFQSVGDIVINLTADLDGAVLSQKMYRYNLEEQALQGTSLVEG